MKIKLIFLLCCSLMLGYTALAQGETKPDDADSEVVVLAEQMPDFVGGDMALYEFISKNMIYPKAAKENGIECKVIASFIIEKDGSLSTIKFLRTKIGYGIEEEAERILKLMPKWQPGKQNGKAIRVRYTLPIKFQMNN